MTVAGVVLAAGAGTRFAASGGNGPKQLARVGEWSLVERAVAAAHEGGGLAEVAVVVGAVDLSGLLREEAVVLLNDRWADGIATSLQVGVHWARERGHEAVVVGLADQPGVTADAWRAVAGAPADPPIAVATYSGRRGNPVRLHSSVWRLLPASGDEGARSLMRERPELVQEIPCTGEPDDIDTLEDLDRWS